MTKPLTLSLVTLAILLPSSAFSVPTAEVRRVGIALERMHYSSQRALNDSKSRKIFDQFIERLDPEKVYFTHRDINYLEAIYSHRLDDDIKGGTLESAPKIYSHFKKRVNERIQKVEGIIGDLREDDLGEEVGRRGKDSEWCGSEDEIIGTWRGKITGELVRIINRSTEKKEERLAKAKELLLKKYLSIQKEVNSLENDFVKEAFLSSACQSYDPHSDYLGPKKMTEFDISMGLQLGGIGAVLGDEGDGVRVISLVPGGPAAQSGKLFKGDKIYAVGDCATGTQDVSGLPIDKVVELIRGEKGSTVCLEVDSEVGGKGRMVKLVRDQVQLNDQAVKGAVVEVGGVRIGLVIIPSFYQDGEGRSVSTDAEEVISVLAKQGISALVVDIRQDGGGVLEEAIKLAGIFVPGEPVVQIKNGDGRVQVRAAPAMGAFWGGPLVILVDRYSASASEIFCGAIQDHRAGIVVGDSQTFGKGTVQAVMELERTPLLRLFTGEPSTNNGAVKITVQKFYRASGLSTQAKGVSSDIVIPSPTDLGEIGEAALRNHLPFDRAETLKLSEGRVCGKQLELLKTMSQRRVEGSVEFAERIRNLSILNNPDKMISLKGEIIDTHDGLLSQDGIVVTSLRGGETATQTAKLYSLYEGVPMPRFPLESRDYSLEESLLIARDMVGVADGDSLARNQIDRSDP